MKKYTPIILIILLSGCGWSKSDIAWGVASTLATGADFYTTSEALENPNNTERHIALKKRPSNSEVAILTVSTLGISLALAHIFPKLRPWLLGAKTVISTGAAINNSRLEK